MSPLDGYTKWRYNQSIMATGTATIRVPRATHDQLAQQARERGVSLSSLLTQYAEELAREAIFRSEREATLADAENTEVAAEERDWETALADGLD